MKSLITSVLMFAAWVSSAAAPVYSFGHKVFALAPNASGIGQAITVTDEMATVIGQGVLPTPDFSFETQASMLDWCKTEAASNAIASFGDGLMLAVTNDADATLNGPYYVRDLNAGQDPTTGWADLYQLTPHKDRDAVIRGKHNWNYGRSMGTGTFNIMAVGDGVVTNGLDTVYINGIRLSQLIGVHLGADVTVTNWNAGVAKVSSGPNYAITIGDGASATGWSSTYAQGVAVGNEADAYGEAGVAVGPKSMAGGSLSVALGWRANAVGAHSVAIGAAGKSHEDYWTDYTHSTVNTNSDLTLAEAGGTIAIGYNAKARADGAVQLGTGENTTPNTLKFQNCTIVKDGHVTGSVPDPQQVDPTLGTDDEVLEITVDPGSMTTLMPTRDCGPGTEMLISCSAPSNRNNTIFIPNEPKLRVGLPGSFEFELPDGVRGTIVGPATYATLPVRIGVEQPYGKLVVANVTPLDDGYDWTPSVTNHNLAYRIDLSAGEAKLVTTNKTQAILGESLHCATNVTISYWSQVAMGEPRAYRTIPILTLPAGKEYMSQAYYGYVGWQDDITVQDPYTPETKTRGSYEYIEAQLTYHTLKGSCSTNIEVEVITDR